MTGPMRNRFGGVALAGAALLFLSACGMTTQTVVPVAADGFQVTVQAHRECDLDDIKVIASRRIAVETIRRGFDSYAIVGSASRSFNPTQEYTVRMFKRGQGAAALDAREALGPGWAKIVAEFDERSCRV